MSPLIAILIILATLGLIGSHAWHQWRQYAYSMPLDARLDQLIIWSVSLGFGFLGWCFYEAIFTLWRLL